MKKLRFLVLDFFTEVMSIIGETETFASFGCIVISLFPEFSTSSFANNFLFSSGCGENKNKSFAFAVNGVFMKFSENGVISFILGLNIDGLLFPGENRLCENVSLISLFDSVSAGRNGGDKFIVILFGENTGKPSSFFVSIPGVKLNFGSGICPSISIPKLAGVRGG